MSKEPLLNQPEPGLTQRTLVSLFWMFSGTGAQGVLQFIVLIVLARLLTPEDFGVVTAALIVINFSAIFSQLGVGPAIVQRPNLTTDHIRTGFTFSLLFSAALAVTLYALAPAIASFFDMDTLPSVIRALSLTFMLTGLSVVAQVLLQRDLQFRRLAAIEVLSHLLGYSLVGITMAVLGYGVWALVAASIAKAAVQSTLLLFARPFPKAPQLNTQAFRELMYFGGGFTIGRFFNYLALQGDYLVVGRGLGPVALGVYGRAYELMVTPASLFGRVLDVVLFPAMAKVQTEPKRLVNAYRRGLALVGLLTLPSSMAVVVLAPELIATLLGPKWADVVAPLQILALGMFFRTSYKVSESAARATGAVYRRAGRQGVYAAAVLMGAWIGQGWGTSGVAWGVLGAITLNFWLMTQLGLQISGLSWRGLWVAHASPLLLTFCGAVVLVPLTLLLRAWHQPHAVILFVGLAAVVATLLVLIRLFPSFALGKDGEWLLSTLRGYLPVPFRKRSSVTRHAEPKS